MLSVARNDIAEILQGEFSSLVKITNLQGHSVQLNALASKHHLGVDPENGNPVNSKNAHVTLPEKILVDLGYVVRNASNEVSLIGHKIEYTDSAGILCKFRINETFPDETLGAIVCILGDQNG